MNILELEKFKIEDAINFHDELNPLLFDENNKLKPNIKNQLEIITDDFVEYMGIPDLAIEDVIITGSNVAFTYTPHSDIDLHLLVDFAKLPESDVYKELFNAKKSLYNDTYEITIRDIPVEVYVQDTAQSHTSLGEYSLMQDKFTRYPSKQRANLDEISAEHKFERLEQLAIEGLKAEDIEKVNNVLSIIKRYRQAGLDNKGEFGPENLAFKAIRSKGYFQALFDLRNKLRAQQLSIEEEMFRRTFEESIGVYNSKVNIAEDMSKEDLADQWNVSTKEISKAIDFGVKVEMKNNPQVTATTPQLRREQATKITIDNLVQDVEYYPKMVAFIRAVNQLNKTTSTNDGKGSDVNDVSKMNEASGDDLLEIKRRLATGRHLTVESKIEDKIQEFIDDIKDAKRYRAEIEKDERYQQADKNERHNILWNEGASDGNIQDMEDMLIFFKSVLADHQKNGTTHWWQSFGHGDHLDTAIRDDIAGHLSHIGAWKGDLREGLDEASGYIPSEAERNDPRFSRALSVDVHPDTMKKGAKAMGLGDIARDGRPPLLRPGKKKTKNSKTEFGKGIY